MMQHALGVCSLVLAAGRYRWGHDGVLAVIVEMVQQEMISRERVEKEEEAMGERFCL